MPKTYEFEVWRVWGEPRKVAQTDSGLRACTRMRQDMDLMDLTFSCYEVRTAAGAVVPGPEFFARDWS